MSKSYRKARSFTRRDFMKVSAGFGAGAGLLVACGPKATELIQPTQVPVEPTENLMPETTDLIYGAWGPQWFSAVRQYVALDKGWYAEEGIESVDIVIPGEQQIFPGLIGGSLNIAQHDTDGIASAVIQGEPIYMIGNNADKEPWLFCVAPGIETVDDLKGLDVSGGSAGSRNEANGMEMLRQLGMEDPENDVNWVPVSGGSDARVEAVAAGILGGCVCFTRHRVILNELGGKVLYDELAPNPQNGFCAHGTWMEKNERTLVVFLKTMLRANQLILDLSTKDYVIQVLEANDYEMPQEFIDDYENSIALFSDYLTFDPASMEKTLKQSADLGLISREIDWKEFCRFEYLNQALDELGMGEHKMAI